MGETALATYAYYITSELTVILKECDMGQQCSIYGDPDMLFKVYSSDGTLYLSYNHVNLYLNVDIFSILFPFRFQLVCCDALHYNMLCTKLC